MRLHVPPLIGHPVQQKVAWAYHIVCEFHRFSFCIEELHSIGVCEAYPVSRPLPGARPMSSYCNYCFVEGQSLFLGYYGPEGNSGVLREVQDVTAIILQPEVLKPQEKISRSLRISHRRRGILWGITGGTLS